MRHKMLMMMLLAVPLVLTSCAYADLISIGLQQAGVNGGAITTVATSSTGAAFVAPMAYGTFKVVQVSAQDFSVLGPPALLNSQSLNTSSSSPGVLFVYVTAQGLSATGVINFVSSFAVNSLGGSIHSITETTEFSPTNLLFTGTPLNHATFSAINTAGPFTTPGKVAGLYSVTEIYKITDVGGGTGSSNLTIDLSGTAIPEPASLGILGVSLLGIAVKLRRKITDSSCEA